MFARFRTWIWLKYRHWLFTRWEVTGLLASAQRQAHIGGVRQGQVMVWQQMAEDMDLRWPSIISTDFYQRLKLLWISSDVAICYQFPIFPLENPDGEHIGFGYEKTIDLAAYRWSLAALWMHEKQFKSEEFTQNTGPFDSKQFFKPRKPR